MNAMHARGARDYSAPVPARRAGRLATGAWLPLAVAVLAVGGAAGCGDDGLLKAKLIERQDELIGGPSAKAKIGDFLLENDRIRVVIGGPGPGYSAGVFGGTVLDVDLRRPEAEYRGGHGWDSFSESFPLANLLVVNPSNPTEAIRLDAEGVQVDLTNGGVFVLEDGSNGREATIRVTGHSAYMFDVMKFLNRDFIDKLIDPLTLGAFGELNARQIADLVPGLLGMDVNLFGLLNRLQINFDFQTDYTLVPGKPYLIQKTVVTLSAPSNKLLGGCAPVACDLDCGAKGYAFAEVEEPDPDYSVPYKRMCPICACADDTADMPTFNESRDFFKVLLGEPERWADPMWKGGIVAGDFLFYGSESPPFLPGFGYDIDRKIYENMWQGVGTMGSPIVADWIAATGWNVSYAWSTVNPRAKDVCDTYRVGIVRADPAKEADIATALTASEDYDLAYNLAARDAAARVRQLVVDRKPLFLSTVATGVPATADALPAWRAQVLAAQRDALAAATGLAVAIADDDGLVMQNPADGFAIDLFPAHACMQSKVMIPLFSTSATAVLTHFTEGDAMVPGTGGAVARDNGRTFQYQRYLSVGDGDVASAVEPLYELRGTPVGRLAGEVLEEGSFRPVSHVHVFVARDYRTDPANEPVPASWAEYRRAAIAAYGNSGLVTQMQSDPGIDRSFDGAFGGPVPPGRYFVFAHDSKRGTSPFAAVEIAEGAAARVSLRIPPTAQVEYRITDQAGNLIPARLTFQVLDADGNPQPWAGTNEPELGDSRLDHGIVALEHSAHGKGTVSLPAGRYDVTVSRGFEYAAKVIEDFEVVAGRKVTLRADLAREIDTAGRIGADLHVHAQASTDSSLPNMTRVNAALAEGLEFFTASDHDHMVDYMPYLMQEGLEGFLQTVTSVEISPLEYGHYNAYPLKYDERKGAINGAPGWQGRTMREIWDLAKSMSDAPDDAYIMQVNHPRDGFMGYFAQIGMKGYSLERKTPGMEMCNQALAEAPCDFDAMEILNGKNLQYIHTPTVGEVERHNRCYREVVAMRDPSLLSWTKHGAGAVCGWLQADPPGCAEAAAKAADASLPEAERGEWTMRRDHCTWHAEMRAEFEHCADGMPDGWTAVDCKRAALEGLKLLGVRYMMERTQEENDVYFATTEETDIGCSHQDACQPCVQALIPACKNTWSTDCVIACRDQCPTDDMKPCIDRQEMVQDWFHFLDVGFDKAIVGNSDSHGTLKEIGGPRNYIASSTDKPQAIDHNEIFRAIKRGDVVVSAGPYVEFRLVDQASGREAGLAQVLEGTDGGKVLAHVRVQTPSWFKVDRVEIWRNSQLEKRFFPDRPVADVVDFDEIVELDMPDIDSWYVVMAYGVGADTSLSPVYKRPPYGDILISTIIGLALDQVLASFGSLLDTLGPLLGGSLDSLTGSIELPDSYESLPWAATNPIRLDVDGGGFRPPRAVDADGDGQWDPPPFCSKPCDPADENPCGANQVCAPRPKRPSDTGPDTYVCWIPTPAHCVGLQKVAGVE
jgi:hypothetical protein